MAHANHAEAGAWIRQSRLDRWRGVRGKGSGTGGKDYNHSTYCDLIISGLVGLRPQGDDRLVVAPLAPAEWDYFCLDHIRYHNHNLTIAYDKTGLRYQKGKGLRLYCDGKEIAGKESPDRIEVALPALKQDSQAQDGPAA